MTGPRNSEAATETSRETSVSVSGGRTESPAEGKRPWRTPSLRHLGSVRELTLGATMGMPEGGGTLMIPGM